MSLISWGDIGRGEFFPLKSLWKIFKHLATFGGFHFLFGLGAFIAPLCVSLVLRHTDDAVQARLGREALELQNEEVLQGDIQANPPPSWLVNLPLQRYLPQKSGFNSRPHEGKPMVNKQAFFSGGVYLRRGRLTGQETTLEATKIT